MKGDFSRIRFNPAKDYTSVLEQQGRVSLDADANEQRAIEEYLRLTQTMDTLGESGGPVADAGFHITLKKDGIHFSAGRYYVHGLLCETKGGHYNAQPHLIDPQYADLELLQALMAGKLTGICLELQVWQRLVTALDDPCLLESALGQADTTVRLQTVWRVIAKPVAPAAKITGLHLNTPLLKHLPSPSRGTLCAQLTSTQDDCSCDPIPPAGYTGLENQLYRVEIHRSGNETNATFKWSSENASIVAAVLGLSGSSPHTVFVDSLGKDANLGFATGQWVEVTDDSNLFGEIPNQPGALYQIKGISGPGEAPALTLNAPVLGIDPSRNARVRRWDQASAAASGDIPISSSKPIDIESGIQVSFTPGEYLSGDYWLIPARTASGTIDWPPCGKGNRCQPPARTVVTTVPLAFIIANPPKNPDRKGVPPRNLHLTHLPDFFQIEDLRRFFAPIASTAIHVEGINWRNDDLMTVDEFAFHGLKIDLDRTPTSHIDPSIFRVSLEANPLVNGNYRSFNPATTQAATLRANSQTIDGIIAIENKTILWSLGSASTTPVNIDPVGQLINELNLLTSGGDATHPTSCTRVRVRLLSHFTSVTNGLACGDARTLYLDGQCFGRPAKRKNGSPSTAMHFPSGNNAVATDFESWFFLAPAVQLKSLTFNPTTVTAATANNITTAVTVGTVTLASAAATDTPIQLTSTPVAGLLFSFPTPPPVIPAGQLSVNFKLTMIVLSYVEQNAPCYVRAFAAWKAGLGSNAEGSFNLMTIASTIEPPPQLQSLAFLPALAPQTFQNNSSSATTIGTVSLVAAVLSAAIVQLSMEPVAGLSFILPKTVVIPTGQVSASFTVVANIKGISTTGTTPDCVCDAHVAWAAGPGSSTEGRFNVSITIAS